MDGSRTRTGVPAALLLLGLAAVLLLTFSTRDLLEPPGFMYGVVLDAGSSHTALLVYRWPADKHNGTGLVSQHSECHASGGGISSYVDGGWSSWRSVEMCLQGALKVVPPRRHGATPVYLGATAGMRLLRASDPERADEILQEVGRRIRTFPFKYMGATILSGQEEGAFGWVTANYLSENFIKYGLVGRWLGPAGPTVGALDFGGASTQITFETSEVEDNRDLMELQLYGRTYTIYTHSYLCYGQDQVLKRLLAHLLKVQGYPDSVSHPCYPAGLVRVVDLDLLFASPCTAALKPPGPATRRPLTVLGGGHYAACLGNVSQMFLFDGCPFSRCSFDQVFQPGISGSFLAFSAFFYLHSFLQRSTGVSVDSPSQLEAASRALCAMTFPELLQVAPDQEARLQDYCASSVFVQLLLLRGYGFNGTSFPGISFQKKVGGASLGWALGYMLSLSNMVPAEAPAARKALAPAAWAALLVLLVLLLAATLLFILLRLYADKKKKRRGGDAGAI